MTTRDAAARMSAIDDERSAAAELARAYGRLVFEAAYRVLGQASAAEDVQQDVFLRLVERMPSGVTSWPAWLRASAVRLAIDRLRHRRRWRHLFALFGRDEDADAPVPDSELDATRRERSTRLRAALATLPAREAQCFALRWIEGLELDEIARAAGITPNTASVALHRATRRLERLLADPSVHPEA